MATLWETIKPLEAKANQLRSQLSALERRMEQVLRSWQSGSPPAPTRSSEGARKATAPGSTKAKGKTFSDSVLSHVKGKTSATEVLTAMGLKPTDRRRVYKTLLRASKAGRIAKVGEGTFAPKK